MRLKRSRVNESLIPPRHVAAPIIGRRRCHHWRRAAIYFQAGGMQLTTAMFLSASVPKFLSVLSWLSVVYAHNRSTRLPAATDDSRRPLFHSRDDRLHELSRPRPDFFPIVIDSSVDAGSSNIARRAASLR